MVLKIVQNTIFTMIYINAFLYRLVMIYTVLFGVGNIINAHKYRSNLVSSER